LRELAAQEFDEQTRPWTAIRPQQTHPVKKNQQIENLCVFEGTGSGAVRLLLFDFVEQRDKRGVEFTLQR